MPIYEFKCKKCGNKFEYLCFNSKDAENAQCPNCGAQETERLLSCFSSMSSGGALTGTSSCSPSGGFS